MKKHKFKKGDLVRVGQLYGGAIFKEPLESDVGIVVNTAPHPRWPHLISVYWSILQKEVELQRVYLEPINEKA